MDSSTEGNIYKNSNTIGSKLKGLRRRNFLTLEQLATKSGIKENTLRSWELNRRTPALNNLAVLIKAFEEMGTKIDIDWLYQNNNEYENIPYISKHVIFEDNLYKLALEKAKEKLDLQKNRYTLEEVHLEVLEQYKKMFLRLSKEKQEQ